MNWEKQGDAKIARQEKISELGEARNQDSQNHRVVRDLQGHLVQPPLWEMKLIYNHGSYEREEDFIQNVDKMMSQ